MFNHVYIKYIKKWYKICNFLLTLKITIVFQDAFCFLLHFYFKYFQESITRLHKFWNILIIIYFMGLFFFLLLCYQNILLLVFYLILFLSLIFLPQLSTSCFMSVIAYSSFNVKKNFSVLFQMKWHTGHSFLFWLKHWPSQLICVNLQLKVCFS